MDSKSTNSDDEKMPKRSFLDRFKHSQARPEESSEESPETQAPIAKPNFTQRMRSALSRTGEGLGSIFLGSKVIDEELLEELETSLLIADVGIETTAKIIADLTAQSDRQSLKDGAALKAALEKILIDRLSISEKAIDFERQGKPFVMLVVGVNGVGKTTTIGKLAQQIKGQGRSVMLAAGDTFRAAAVEQLQVWGERNQLPVVAQHTGADSASVIFDAIQAAKSRDVDVIIADTAGRLHNKSNLMEELKKVKRVASKLDETAPHEVLLVLDAGTGQNALAQMAEFNQVVGVTGLALTKLDGTAKGGIVFALADKFAVPIRYIGVGEGPDDLQPFIVEDFVQALLNTKT
ncbi:MAG TPA: signal recognition particle-docking protein FtsY [Porticoccaceae bacterium]|nr:signal recognition particle-docking protein FtsY [Porticoccaceae bacterium]HIK80017.1 signal recognition particle-docking protein FtsY [Porticoccaceae bacterium]